MNILSNALMEILDSIKPANNVKLALATTYANGCGCTGNCGQSCSGGCETGCSGTCGRSCSGNCS